MNTILRKKLPSDSRRMLSVGTGLPSGCVLPPLLLSAQHPFYGTHGIQHLPRHSQQPQYQAHLMLQLLHYVVSCPLYNTSSPDVLPSMLSLDLDASERFKGYLRHLEACTKSVHHPAARKDSGMSA